MDTPLKRFKHDSKGHNSEKRSHKKLKHKGDASKKEVPSKVLILDNGGYSMKIGYSYDKKPANLPNCVMKAKSERKRAFIADQIEDCRDLSGLFFIRPHEKGYITKYDVQKNIWDYTFQKYPIDYSTVLMTQPVYNFKSIQEYTDEVFFEEYDIRRMMRATVTDYSYFNYIKEFKEADTPTIVIDSGFSFTHIVPYINGRKYAEGIIRLDLGGKLLTNYLKDIISYRQLHVMEETHVINQVKEDVCYMSQNFLGDMKRAKETNEIVKNYLLPDFHSIRRGYIEENITPEISENYQILRLNNERITIPEIMMHPSIIYGLQFAGLAECLYKSIMKCPTQYQSELSSNVVFTGGNSLFSGFRERLEKDTRVFLPCDYKLKIYQPEDPINYAWFGGKTMAKDPSFKSHLVTKRQYEEEGSSYIFEKFNKYFKLNEEKPQERKTYDSFSYINYWKNEGVDIFQKTPPKPIKDPEVQFKLEGDNIEEYDGKYVTIEFEFEKPPEEEQNTEVKEKEEEREMQSEELQRIKRRKNLYTTTNTNSTTNTAPVYNKTILRPISTVDTSTNSLVTQEPVYSSTLVTSTPTAVTNVSKILTTLDSSQIRTLTTGQVISFMPNNVVKSNLVLPKLTRIQPKMFTPSILRSVSSSSNNIPESNRQVTQYITLGGNTVNLSDALILPSSSTKNVIAPTRILNNAVIVPQNLLSSKNLTFKIFPIRNDNSSQSNIIIKKKPT